MTERERHLDLLADAVIANLEDGGDSHFGLDGKRPFGGSVGSDVLRILGIEPAVDHGDGYFDYSDDQEDYARDLRGDVLNHIKDRWRRMRAAEGRA